MTDIAILGGGLSGLTLALQLRGQLPDADIKVLERQQHPVPEAAHKVGESTVEIGAHYLANVVGLKEHLQDDHLRKYGLRLFFDAGRSEDLSQAAELGASHLLSIPGYQVDRGILENHLADRVQAAGIELVNGATITDLSLNEENEPHRIHYRADGNDRTMDCRWVVDAMSRGSVIKRRLNLAENNGHRCSSVWFRISELIDVAHWSTDVDWQNRCTQLPRMLSTNHLMGPGYWVWLIPLSSGSMSVGIVFDNDLHDFDRLKTYQGTLDWLARHQPRCHRAIVESPGKLQDFRYLKNFSHGCRQVYSHHRWALTGEAGVFLDPFYSPGSDFIGISNTYITDLICREMAGERIARRAQHYQRIYFSFYQSSLNLYRHQYPMFGHTRAMMAKTIWDYAYYWGVLSLFFFAGKLTDLAFFVRHAPMLEALRNLNIQMQHMFLAWAESESPVETSGLFVNQSALPLLVRLNRELTETLEDPALDQRLTDNGGMLTELAGELRELAPETAAARVDLHREGVHKQSLLTGLPEDFVAPRFR